MSNAQTVPNAWDDEWETQAETRQTSEAAVTNPKKISSRASKAQRRAQQAEFNRQLWAEAEGPRETFHFLETRPGSNVPLRSDFKPAPVLLSRKGPPKSQSPAPPTNGIKDLSVEPDDEDPSDEEENKTTLTLQERQVRAAKEREEKQRRYEERREELFGPKRTMSGSTTPADATPPGSRSGTPGRGRGGKPRNAGSRPSSAIANAAQDIRNLEAQAILLNKDSSKELYDQDYSARPDSSQFRRKEGNIEKQDRSIRPSRTPRGPDGSGFGFAPRNEQSFR
ncbi:MAG: hypothetical protein Q9227_006394 [Pyrenula ochraceoflavens]